jgi:hypothetical protein
VVTGFLLTWLRSRDLAGHLGQARLQRRVQCHKRARPVTKQAGDALLATASGSVTGEPVAGRPARPGTAPQADSTKTQAGTKRHNPSYLLTRCGRMARSGRNRTLQDDPTHQEEFAACLNVIVGSRTETR